MKTYFVYILGSRSGTLYIGITNNLERRVLQHKKKAHPGFTKRYNIDRLLYYEETDDVKTALTREKQLKSWRRDKKMDLIETINFKWIDLSEEWYE